MSTGSLTAQRTVSVGRLLDKPEVAVWLLLAPCLIYLAAFAIYPLIYSLRLSFTDLTATEGTGKWVGFSNYVDLLSDPLFWNAAKNSVIMVAASVSLQVVLGVAMALFFNLELTGAWIVRGILVLPMLLTPIVVGVMWRALLNPDWGLINWMIARVGLRAAQLARVDRYGDEDAGAGRRLAMDAVRLHHRLCTAAGAAAGRVRGGATGRRQRIRHLPPSDPAAADAGHFVRRRVPRHRRVPLVRPDLWSELWRSGPQHHHAELLFVPERLCISELRLRRGGGVHDAAHPDRRHHGAAAICQPASGREA